MNHNSHQTINNLEEEHQQTIRKLNRETDWLAVFPEAKEAIITKTNEFLKEAEIHGSLLKQHLSPLQKANYQEFDKYFFEQLYTAKHAPHIVEAYQHILRWNRTVEKQQLTPTPQPTSTHRYTVTDSDIETAKNIPIDELFEQDGHQLKRSSFNFVTLCPFHDEKTPSCTLYTNDNQYHCFGCQAHGDTIEYVKQTRNLDFIQAVKYLINKP